MPHNTDLHVATLCCWGKAVFLFCQKAHPFSIFRGKSAFSFDFSENRKFSVPYGAKIFSFLAVQNQAPEKGAIMRKQIQKERCTKIKLEKCPRVCCLYDKVQLAAARMLNADPSIVQIECNIPLSAGRNSLLTTSICRARPTQRILLSTLQTVKSPSVKPFSAHI